MLPKYDRFNLEKINDFIKRNLEALGVDTQMAPGMVRATCDAEGIKVVADGTGWFVLKNGIVVAQLSKREIVNDRRDMENYPDLQTVDPARKIQILAP